MGLEQLSPAYQAQYNALVPEIERSVRSSNNARGMFYSGQATDAEARAKADLLAKLASESAATEATASENAKNRQTQTDIHNSDIKAGKRNALLDLIGGGTSAAATIAGLNYMHPQQIIPMGMGADGKMAYGTLAPDGKSLVPLGGPSAGVTPTAPVAGAITIDPLTGMPPAGPMTGPWRPGMEPGAVPAAGAGATAAVAARPSMWQSATSLPSIGAGAVGGGLGYLGARAVNGGGSTGSDIGAGLGGLGGYLAAARYAGGNPWAAGLGALAGSFGGGLLGNLFK